MAEAVKQARRRLSTVLVEGLDELGFTLARQLINAGVGTVLLCDESPVTGAEANSYRSLDTGRVRAEAAIALLEDPGGASILAEAPEGAATLGVDLHIFCDSPEKLATRGRATEDPGPATPILPVLQSTEEIRTGPLLNLPSGPCPGCLHRYGLLGPNNPGGEGVAVAAALAAWQTQVLIDGQYAADIETSGWLLRSATGELMQFRPQPHQGCPCLTTRL